MDVRQVLALAVEKEEAAGDLYEGMAEESDDPAVKALLGELAAEERKHKELLQGVEPADIPALRPGELRAPRIAAFLQVRPLSPEPRLQDVLAYAIRREQEAEGFYAQMSQRVHRDDLGSLFGSLAAMENRHMVRLEDLYETMFLQES